MRLGILQYSVYRTICTALIIFLNPQRPLCCAGSHRGELLSFALFFVVNTPDGMARMQLGIKRDDGGAIENGSSSAAPTNRCLSAA